MSGGPSLKAKIVNFRLMPSLIAATLASEKPTDGYLVNDVIKMSFESQQVRLFLQEYLMNQLVTSRNVFVKTKVLKLFIELVTNGHPEVRQNLLKQLIPFNDASKLRCDNPDLAGDVGRIRDLAKKLLDMLYDESITVTPPTLVPRSNLGTSSATSRSKYTGFGSTAAESSKPANRSILSGRGLFSRSRSQEKASDYDEDYASMKPIFQNTDQNNVIRVTPAMRPDYSQGPRQHGKEYVRGEAGGGWQGGGNEQTNSGSSRLQTDSRRYQPAEEEQQNTVTIDGCSEEEQKVVDMITAPGGIRAAPARDQLDQFIKKCKSLDVLIITDLLKEKLQSESQQVVLRTLFVLETMLRSDIPSVESCLDLTLDELSVLCQSPQASVKSKATKLMKQLGATTVSEGTTATSGGTTVTSTSTMATAPSNASGNIIDLDTSSVADNNSYNEQQQSTAGMFEGLSVTNSNNVAPPTTTNNSNNLTSLFGDMSLQAPTSNQPANTDDDGLIDLGDQDDMFDPLVRSSSISSRTGSLLRSSGSASSQSAFAFLKQSSTKGEELTGSGNLFGAPPSANMQQQPQQIGMAAHTMQPAPQQMGMATHTMQPPPQQMGVAAHTMQLPPMMGMNMMSSYNMSSAMGGPVYQQQQQQFGYPTAQQVQNTNYHNQVPLLGNSARPVQLANQTGTDQDQEELNDSFSFLEKKSSKASAFDFVQDEMKARMKSS